MTMNLRSFSDKDSQSKKEDDPSGQSNFIPRHWSSYKKNPRIVRVSRAFGGKDRHSKVCTMRGLKDRRIRLSIPTAIQIYDLQHRLGLSQPSKVVDWLLDATKQDIDKLPPLPMIPIYQAAVPSHSFGFTLQPSLPHFISSNSDSGISTAKQGGLGNEGFEGFVAQISAQNLFPLITNSNNYNQPSNLLPNLAYSSGASYPFLNQSVDHERPYSSLLQPSSELQYFCTSALPPFSPSFPPVDADLRQVNQQMNQLQPTTLSLVSNSAAHQHQHVSSRTVFLSENDARRWQKDCSSSKPGL